jgi:hypothetical protein
MSMRRRDERPYRQVSHHRKSEAGVYERRAGGRLVQRRAGRRSVVPPPRDPGKEHLGALRGVRA